MVFWRAGAKADVTFVPVEQDSFFEKSCRDGIATGCFRQAWILWGRNRESDRDRALEIYRRACRAGSAEACAYEGLRLMDMAG